MGVNQDYCLIKGWVLPYRSIKELNSNFSETDLDDKIDQLKDLYGRWAHNSNKNPKILYLIDLYNSEFEIIGERVQFYRDSGSGCESGNPVVFKTSFEENEIINLKTLIETAEKETGLSISPLLEADPVHISIFYYS